MELLIWIFYMAAGFVALSFLIKFFTGVISNPFVLIIAGIVYAIVAFSVDGIM